jgi:SurA N-terminal domain
MQPTRASAPGLSALAPTIATLVAILSLALGGCGAAKTPAVASVEGTVISRAALAHWTRIKRLELHSGSSPSRTSDRGQPQRAALAFLITAEWLQGEAKAQGVEVSSAEVDSTYERLLSSPTGPSFARGLGERGISGADELLLLRLQQLSNKLQAKIAGGAAGASPEQAAARERRVAAFAAAYRRRWKQRTSCRAGYIVPECSNGPALPQSPR